MCLFNDSVKCKAHAKLEITVKWQIVVSSRVRYTNAIIHLDKCVGDRDFLTREFLNNRSNKKQQTGLMEKLSDSASIKTLKVDM